MPHRGAAPALQDLIAGRIDVLFDHLAHVAAAGEGGQSEGLCGGRQHPLAHRADIPTVDEAGYPGLYTAAQPPTRSAGGLSKNAEIDKRWPIVKAANIKVA